MFEERLVGRRRRVVKLVNDHHLEGVRRQLFQSTLVQRLDRREDMGTNDRFLSTRKLLAKTSISQSHAESGQALIEDVVSVGNEEQARTPRLERVVEGGDDGFSRACGGNDQIACVTLGALDLERIQNSPLVWERTESDDMGEGIAPRITAPLARLEKALSFVGFEARIVPVLLEGGLELGQQRSVETDERSTRNRL